MQKHKQSIRATWIWTYFIVIFAMGAIFFCGQGVVQRKIVENAKNANYEKTVFVKNALDESWQSFFDYSIQLIESNGAKALENNYDQSMWLHNAYQCSKEVMNYLQHNDVIRDVMILYPSKDYIVGGRGVFDTHAYWALGDIQNNTVTYEKWLQEVFIDRKGGYFTLQNGNNIDLYFRVSSPDSAQRVMVAKIDTVMLEQRLNWVRHNDEATFLAVTDEKGTVYAYCGNKAPYVNDDNRLDLSRSKNVVCNQVRSDCLDMQYVTIAEESEVIRFANTAKNVALIGLVAALAVGVLVLVFLVNYNARPIERLAAKLAAENSVSGNELEIINEQIDDLLRKNQQSVSQYRQQQHILVLQTFLNEALRFDQTNQKDIETLATLYGINFENDRFSVVIRERSQEDYGDRLRSYLGRIDMEDFHVAWTQKQDLDVFLANYDAEALVEDRDGQKKTHYQIFLNDLRRDLSDEAANIVYCEEFTTLNGVRGGYLDCLKQLNRKEIALLSVRDSAERYSFSELQADSALQSFRSHIKNEDYALAKEILPMVCAVEHGKDVEFRCRKYTLISWLLQFPERFSQEAVAQLDQQTTMEALQSTLEQLLGEKIVSREESTESDRQDDLAGKIRKMIEDSCQNPMLGLYMIAEELGMSQSYVSRLFKKQYGIGITQYIHQVRIAKSKELLANGSLSIKEIALMMGYAGDIQFIRTFKKLENITPGAYQQMMNGQK